MKKLILPFAVVLLFSMPEITEASENGLINSKTTESVHYSGQTAAAKTEVLGGGRRDKNGKYRKKKGFLWGLFKGKNQCDCPKH